MTGAIFARGSCRALMWVLALGVAAVLSAGEAAAQTPKLSKTNLTLNEGGSAGQLTLTVTFPAGTAASEQTVSMNAATNSVVKGSFTLTDPSGSSTFDGTGDTARDITVGAGASVLLTVTANDDNDGEDGRAVVTFTIGGESTSLILVSNDDDARLP